MNVEGSREQMKDEDMMMLGSRTLRETLQRQAGGSFPFPARVRAVEITLFGNRYIFPPTKWHQHLQFHGRERRMLPSTGSESDPVIDASTSSSTAMAVAAVQAAKKDLRKRMRDVLRSIPSESIVQQCQSENS